MRTQRRRQWHPTPVLLPGKSHGWRSLVGCSPQGREKLDTTERLHFHFSLLCIEERDHVSEPESAVADAGITGQGLESNWQASAPFLLILQHTNIAFPVFKLKTISLAQKSETEQATVHPL